MESAPFASCPVCHQSVSSEAYFCSNCGANLKPKPPTTTISGIILLFAGSILLPPMGLWWGLKYLRTTDKASRTVGITAMLLTLVSLVIGTLMVTHFMNTVNEQINSQMPGIMGF